MSCKGPILIQNSSHFTQQTVFCATEKSLIYISPNHVANDCFLHNYNQFARRKPRFSPFLRTFHSGLEQETCSTMKSPPGSKINRWPRFLSVLKFSVQDSFDHCSCKQSVGQREWIHLPTWLRNPRKIGKRQCSKCPQDSSTRTNSQTRCSLQYFYIAASWQWWFQQEMTFKVAFAGESSGGGDAGTLNPMQVSWFFPANQRNDLAANKILRQNGLIVPEQLQSVRNSLGPGYAREITIFTTQNRESFSSNLFIGTTLFLVKFSFSLRHWTNI